MPSVTKNPSNRLPKHVTIYGKQYIIKQIKGLKCPYTGSPAAGLILHQESVIMICKELPIDEKIRTLYHEIFHGLVHRLTGHQIEFSKEMEEILAEGFACLLDETFCIKFKT